MNYSGDRQKVLEVINKLSRKPLYSLEPFCRRIKSVYHGLINNEIRRYEEVFTKLKDFSENDFTDGRSKEELLKEFRSNEGLLALLRSQYNEDIRKCTECFLSEERNWASRLRDLSNQLARFILDINEIEYKNKEGIRYDIVNKKDEIIDTLHLVVSSEKGADFMFDPKRRYKLFWGSEIHIADDSDAIVNLAYETLREGGGLYLSVLESACQKLPHVKFINCFSAKDEENGIPSLKKIIPNHSGEDFFLIPIELRATKNFGNHFVLAIVVCKPNERNKIYLYDSNNNGLDKRFTEIYGGYSDELVAVGSEIQNYQDCGLYVYEAIKVLSKYKNTSEVEENFSSKGSIENFNALVHENARKLSFNSLENLKNGIYVRNGALYKKAETSVTVEIHYSNKELFGCKKTNDINILSNLNFSRNIELYKTKKLNEPETKNGHQTKGMNL